MLKLNNEIKINLPQGLVLKVFFYKNQRVLFFNTIKSNYKHYYKIPYFFDIKKVKNTLVLSIDPKSVLCKELLVEGYKLNSWVKQCFAYSRCQIELKGIGFKIMLDKVQDVLSFKLGFSHTKSLKIPSAFISVYVRKNIIVLEGLKYKVGNFAQKICLLKMPDSYKEKGFFLNNENVRLKEVKKV